MAISYNYKQGSGCGSSNSCCPDKFGCPEGVCPDFTIRRHDTKPSLKISFEDCNGPIDFTDLVVEVNMWFLARFRQNYESTDTVFRLAADIGFDQFMIGDIIVVDRIRSPEKMLVVGFDEDAKTIEVTRGYHGTQPSRISKGQAIRVFRISNAIGHYEMVYDDETNIDGTINRDVLQSSFLVYNWNSVDTCTPGCFWLEFKVLKMIDYEYRSASGLWNGPVHNENGKFFSGEFPSDASIELYYNSVNENYYVTNLAWEGDIHIHLDGNYYTGTSHSSASVLLNKMGGDSENVYRTYEEIIGMSIIEDSGELSPKDFGCSLGEGVEWVRRYPITGEGYLIRVENSSTSE